MIELLAIIVPVSAMSIGLLLRRASRNHPTW